MPYPINLFGGGEVGIVVSLDKGKFDIGLYKTTLTGASAAKHEGTKILKGLKGGVSAEVGITKTTGSATDLEKFTGVDTVNIVVGGAHVVTQGQPEAGPEGQEEVGWGIHAGPGLEYGSYTTNTEVYSARRGISNAVDAAVTGTKRAASEAVRKVLDVPLPRVE